MNPGVLSAVLFLVAGADGVDDSIFAPTEFKLPVPGELSPVQALPAASLPTSTAPTMALPSATDSDTDGKLPAVWLGTEYLLWYTRKAPLPVPLVTDQPGLSNPIPQAALGQPGTQVLYGGQGINYGLASGLRITAGVTLSADAGLFAEGSWLMLEKQSAFYSASSNSNGVPYIGQPIINASTGQPNTELVSQPNPLGFGGDIKVASTSRLQGWDTNLGWQVYNQGGTQVSLLGGFRSLDLLDTTTIQTTVRDLSGIPGGAGLSFLGVLDTAGSTFNTEDRFRTSNIFYGGQIGGRITQQLGEIFTITGQVKVALGATDEIVTISGYSSQSPPGQPTYTLPGGVLTNPTNIGRYYRSQFSVVPEGTLTVGAQLAPWCRATVGYNFLYLSEVARPGNQIDVTVNRFTIPVDGNYGLGTGPNRPTFNFHGSDYWAQGLTFGLQFSY